VSRRWAARSNRDTFTQADLPLTATPRHRGSVPEPEETAKLAVARRAKPEALLPGYVTTKRPSHPIC